MATMESYAQTTEAEVAGFEPVLVSFSNRSMPDVLVPMAAGAAGRKQLRRPKEKLPVAEDVAPALVRNALDFAAPPLSDLPSMAKPGGAAVIPAAPATSPAPAASFDGGADSLMSIPPDTAGAVSDRFVFNPLNDNVHIFDRAGGRVSQMTLNAFWNVFPAPMNAFDPRTVFDPFERRFSSSAPPTRSGPTPACCSRCRRRTTRLATGSRRPSA